MKYFFKIVIVLVIILFVGCCVYTYRHSPLVGKLLDSFTIEFTEDTTSSAATREYQASLSFASGVLVRGSQIYDFAHDQNIHTECVWTNGQWLETTNKPCTLQIMYFHSSPDGTQSGVSGLLPTTKEEIESRIKSGDIKICPEGSRHDTFCYKIRN
jgi:hypothetical protein